MRQYLMNWLRVPRQLASFVIIAAALLLLTGLVFAAADAVMVWSKVNRLSQLMIGLIAFWLLLAWRDAALGVSFAAILADIRKGNLGLAIYYSAWVLGGLIMIGLWLGGS